MDADDENITTLLSMGFQHIGDIKHALKAAKNDLNEAVAILTNDRPSQPTSGPPYALQDVPNKDIDVMDWNASSSSAMSSTTAAVPYSTAASTVASPQNPGVDQVDSAAIMEFPTTHLYELQDTVFADSWSIPYKKEESLAKCLTATTRLADEGLCDADENCRKFMDHCMPEAFKKLVTSLAVRRWCQEIQEGIFNMLDLFLDLVVARLKHDIIPEQMLQDILTMAFDPESEWSLKNKYRKSSASHWETVFGSRQAYAVSPAGPVSGSCGWLVDLINRFAEKGGFELIVGKFDSEELSSSAMAALLLPLGVCSEYLNAARVCPMLLPCLDRAIAHVDTLQDADLKSKRIDCVSRLLYAVRLLCVRLWPQNVESLNALLLDVVLRMLRTAHFSARMNGLKEVDRLIDNANRGKENSGTIDAARIQDWLAENKVLSVVLEGNIDHVQYTDRIKAIVEFLGPRLSPDELTKLWKMQEGQNNQVVDNIYSLIAAASTRLNTSQFDHLFSLIQKSWGENERIQGRLLSLIGKIGREAWPGKTSTKVLDLLWDLAHLPSLATYLVEQALEEHTAILNDATFKDQIKRNYFVKCIDEIKKGSCVLPALKQLSNITRSIVKPGVNKQDKATLADLIKVHEIVKLVSTSLVKCYKISASVCSSGTDSSKLNASTIVDGRYTHGEYVNTHLDFLQFILQEGDSYLTWNRCRDIWDTMVANPDASDFDRETCCDWFRRCMRDMEQETHLQLFQQKLLKLDPTQMISKMFECFKTFFESVNTHDYKLRSVGNSMVVEKLELMGIDFFWRVALFVPDETIANVAIDNILELSYLNLAPRLKKDPVSLHKRFMSDCYRRLDAAMAAVRGTVVLAAVARATAMLTAVTVPGVTPLVLAPSRPTTLQNVRRLLQMAIRYICTVEELHMAPRSIPPHGASFQGHPLVLRVACCAPKMDITLYDHSNATLRSVRHRIAAHFKHPTDSVQLMAGERILLTAMDQKLLWQLEFEDEQHIAVKFIGGSSTLSHPIREIRDDLCFDDSDAGASGASFPVAASPSATNLSRQSFNVEQEKILPGVVMASGGQVFELLFQVSELEDTMITARVRNLLHLIPTDPSVQDAFDLLTDKDTGRAKIANSSPLASPSCSPKKMNLGKEKESVHVNLRNFFDALAPGMSSFRVLYNLEVLSGKLLPTMTTDGGTLQSAKSFREEFLNAGGLDMVIKIFHKDALLPDIDYDIRQGCYFIALQLARFLLCDQTLGCFELSTTTLASSLHDSPSAKSTPTKDQLLATFRGGDGLSPNVSVAATRAIQTMGVSDFTDTVCCFMRVAWAAAAGKLQLVSTMQPVKDALLFGGSSSILGRSRQSSTGSGASTGSEGEPLSTSSSAFGLPAHQQNQRSISRKDSLIAREALEFLVTCLQLRQQLLSSFYNLGQASDFVIDVALGSPSAEVRTAACEQFCRLGRIRTEPTCNSPRHFLLQVLLKAPVPLWVPTTNTRGTSQRLLSQCTQYFDLLCNLLQKLTVSEQKIFQVNPVQMLNDEIAWMTNFTPSDTLSKQDTDNTLLSGHMRLIRTLFTCDGIDKELIGRRLVPDLFNNFLFPASKLILEGLQNARRLNTNLNSLPKCLGKKFRVAAYDLLVELSGNSSANTRLIVKLLLGMHHKFDPSLAKEFEHEPAVEGRTGCGFVGLKNAGATCYINSVIQQLFMVPGLWESMLSIDEESMEDDNVFFQFQMVLGHLLESKLQYYVPSMFWKCFKLWGQPVNVREQQDAFEFFTHLVDQVDEAIKECDRKPVFKSTFEGLFSDQKICQDCPHRYEREEAFMALNLTVKSHNLHDSLDQFVKGELLEGDNAYFCEKCGQKRNAVKRTCIKTLPCVLVIQLKRFGYDWEANRALKFDDHFKFPWVLDMDPYTEAGVQAMDRQLEAKQSDASSTLVAVSPSSSISSMSATPGTVGSTGRSPLPVLNTSSSMTMTTPTLYELVGVVVHSGQASAGHFYSYIKERRGTSMTNPNKGKWFKFNDTSVEEFDMNDTTVEAECFGGTYKAKLYDSSNSYPETRHRYWNGYMLFYERMDDVTRTPRTPKRNVSRRSFRWVDRDSGNFVSSSTPRKLSFGTSVVGGNRSVPGSPAPPTPPVCTPPTVDPDGLSQLTALVHHGEKQGLFTEKIPPRILRVIQEDNLRFFRNRDIYSDEYFSFVHQLVSCNMANVHHEDFDKMSVDALELSSNFLFNTYLRTRRRQKEVINQWVDNIETLVKGSKAAASWLLDYLASETGLDYIKPFLLECPSREVRSAFASIVEKTIQNFFNHGGDNNNSLEVVVEFLLEMLEKDVLDNCRTCAQYFGLISMYAQMGDEACLHLFKRQAFSRILRFLLGSAALDPSVQDRVPRRWSSSQSQNFSAVHVTLAVLILSCDLRPFRTHPPQPLADVVIHSVPNRTGLPAPPDLQVAIGGSVTQTYLREVVTALREINTPLTAVVDMLEQCSFCNQQFTENILCQIMLQCSSVNCNELKHLFDLLIRILTIEDPLQLERLRHAIDGLSEGSGLQYDGMLTIIKNSHAVDSRRSYQCIKFLVQLANKSCTAKDFLMQTPSKWQWAVNWLKKKMTEHSYWGGQATMLSNEDPNAKSFQRTVSAQDTLAEATALLTEFDYTDADMEMDGFEIDEQAEEAESCTQKPHSSQGDRDAIES